MFAVCHSPFSTCNNNSTWSANDQYENLHVPSLDSRYIFSIVPILLPKRLFINFFFWEHESFEIGNVKARLSHLHTDQWQANNNNKIICAYCTLSMNIPKKKREKSHEIILFVETKIFTSTKRFITLTVWMGWMLDAVSAICSFSWLNARFKTITFSRIKTFFAELSVFFFFLNIIIQYIFASLKFRIAIITIFGCSVSLYWSLSFGPIVFHPSPGNFFL